MHVLQIMASGALGGGADHLLGLMPALRAAGVQCSAAVGDDGPLAGSLKNHGFSVRTLALMKSRTDARGLGRVATVVRRFKPDIVHFHGTRAAFFGALSRPLWRYGAQTVYTAHGLAYRKETARSRRLLFAAAEWAACRADAVISVSHADLEDLHWGHLLAPSRGVHIPNAVDAQRCKPGDRQAARGRLGLPSDAFIVGTTSRLVPQKAVGDLLDALQLFPEGHLVVLGDGPQRSELQSHPMVRNGRARLLGARDDVPQCLPAFDVFTLASHWEGEPIALLEALACGLPCVATRTAGAQEILADSAAGMLVDIGATDQLAAAWSLLRDDESTRCRMGAAGRQHVAARSYTAQAQRILTVYQALLSGP